MRVNKLRAVWVRSPAAQRDRPLLTVRERLRAPPLDARNTMWAMLQAEGLEPPALSNAAFGALAARTLDGPEVGPLLRPLAAAVELPGRQVTELDRGIARHARASAARRRLMTVPGVGPLVALTCASGLGEPNRFRGSRTVGAHLGLTPRRFQSGEVGWSGRTSRAGDPAVGRALCQAANVLNHPTRGWCAPKSRAVRVARRRGLGRAKVALARRLAVVLHELWASGEDYRPKAA